jgi:hypothetical protein
LNEVGALMGEFTPYVEHIDPTEYLERFRQVLSKVKIKGERHSFTLKEMGEIWEECLRVNANGVMPSSPDDQESDQSNTDTESVASNQTSRVDGKRKSLSKKSSSEFCFEEFKPEPHT